MDQRVWIGSEELGGVGTVISGNVFTGQDKGEVSPQADLRDLKDQEDEGFDGTGPSPGTDRVSKG